MILWTTFAGLLLYMEIIYHLGCFGLEGCNPIFGFSLIIIWASIETGIVGSIRKRWKPLAFWIFNIVNLLIYGSQYVYMSIFKQPLMLKVAIWGGGDALSSYWKEALTGILHASPFLLLMIAPLVVIAIFKKKLPFLKSTLKEIEKVRVIFITGVGVLLATMTMLIGDYVDADFAEDYLEFFDPLLVTENMGVLSLVQRDVFFCVGEGFSNLQEGIVGRAHGSNDTSSSDESQESLDNTEELSTQETESFVEETQEVPTIEELDTSPNQLNIDFNKLRAEELNKETTWLIDYMEGLAPSNRNEYTGMFEGYNLIYLSAEGFSPYGIREDLTPTLYKLVNTGFLFPNFYAPLWQTSTSDGEYINCTGLIPDGQFSMRKSGSNNMEFTLPRYFAKEGIKSLAYHNNTLSYYDRHITHNNLGYDFKAAKIGNLDEAVWGDKIFPMENPNAWPASDYEMMQGTIPEYINDERFHVYYMTVSGHMNYNFKGNAMSYKNIEAVSGLEMSENARAYIACHIELDKALQYLLEQLEIAGKLENTVICMNTDHYPYAMTEEQYEELAGKPLDKDLDKFRNNLILWNAGMEENPVVVEKVCGSMDIIPTLLNLFGFEYDSRLYAGRDIFAPEEGMVILNDRSFITDTVIYSRKDKTTTWKVDLEQEAQDEYMNIKRQEVKDRYTFSANILRNNYYKNIKEALLDE